MPFIFHGQNDKRHDSRARALRTCFRPSVRRRPKILIWRPYSRKLDPVNILKGYHKLTSLPCYGQLTAFKRRYPLTSIT